VTPISLTLRWVTLSPITFLRLVSTWSSTQSPANNSTRELRIGESKLRKWELLISKSEIRKIHKLNSLPISNGSVTKLKSMRWALAEHSSNQISSKPASKLVESATRSSYVWLKLQINLANQPLLVNRIMKIKSSKIIWKVIILTSASRGLGPPRTKTSHTYDLTYQGQRVDLHSRGPIKNLKRISRKHISISVLTPDQQVPATSDSSKPKKSTAIPRATASPNRSAPSKMDKYQINYSSSALGNHSKWAPDNHFQASLQAQEDQILSGHRDNMSRGRWPAWLREIGCLILCTGKGNHRQGPAASRRVTNRFTNGSSQYLKMDIEWGSSRE